MEADSYLLIYMHSQCIVTLIIIQPFSKKATKKLRSHRAYAIILSMKKTNRPNQQPNSKHRGILKTLALGLALAVTSAATVLSPAADMLSSSVAYAAKDRTAEIEAKQAIPVESNEIEGWPDGPIVSADAAILVEVNTGTILYAKNIYATEYPASTTKLLTALIAYETCLLSEKVSFSAQAVDIPWDASNMNMKGGEVLTMEQCLWGLLVGSANETANAMGEHISGSMPRFAEYMTEYAEMLGCVNSHFANANGLFSYEHYTCAYDLAVIAANFFQYEELCRMSSTPVYVLTEDNIIKSHNKLFKDGAYEYEYLVGSKTGYTDICRQTLVSCAEKDGMKLVCAVLKEEAPSQFTDTIDLFNYGFSNFTIVDVEDVERDYLIPQNDFYTGGYDIMGNSSPMISMDRKGKLVLPIGVDFSEVTKTLVREGIHDSEVPGSVFSFYDSSEDSVMARVDYSLYGVPIGSCNIRLNAPLTTSNLLVLTGQNGKLPGADRKPASETPEENNTPANPSFSFAGRTIYINLKKVALWAAIVVGVLVLLGIIVKILKSYSFSIRRNRELRRRRRRSLRSAKRRRREDY